MEWGYVNLNEDANALPSFELAPSLVMQMQALAKFLTKGCLPLGDILLTEADDLDRVWEVPMRYGGVLEGVVITPCMLRLRQIPSLAYLRELYFRLLRKLRTNPSEVVLHASKMGWSAHPLTLTTFAWKEWMHTVTAAELTMALMPYAKQFLVEPFNNTAWARLGERTFIPRLGFFEGRVYDDKRATIFQLKDYGLDSILLEPRGVVEFDKIGIFECIKVWAVKNREQFDPDTYTAFMQCVSVLRFARRREVDLFIIRALTNSEQVLQCLDTPPPASIIPRRMNDPYLALTFDKLKVLASELQAKAEVSAARKAQYQKLYDKEMEDALRYWYDLPRYSGPIKAHAYSDEVLDSMQTIWSGDLAEPLLTRYKKLFYYLVPSYMDHEKFLSFFANHHPEQIERLTKSRENILVAGYERLLRDFLAKRRKAASGGFFVMDS